MATSSTKPEASHALDHDLLKTLNLVTPKTTGKALTEAWEGGSGPSCQRQRGAGACEPDTGPAAGRGEGSGTHPAGRLPPAAATRGTGHSRPGPPAKRRRDSGRRGAAEAPSSHRAGLSRAAMVQRAPGRLHAPAEDLEEHVTTGSPPVGRTKWRGEWSRARAHTRGKPSSLGRRNPSFAL